MQSPRRQAITVSAVLGLLAGLIPLAMSAMAPASAQGLSPFETQINAAHAALSAGELDRAVALGDVAIRISPERWDGYAVAGQALLGLRQYEPAADALSKAIERAPEAEQAALRELRRECLVAESGGTALSPADHPAEALAQDAPAPVASSLHREPIPQSPAAIPHSIGSSRERHDQALWQDASTGLMWARPWYYPRNGAVGPWNFSDAQSFCTALDLGDYSNWRLPTIDELQHVFYVSSKAWRWSKPTFDPGFGVDEALAQKQWRPAEFVIGGDHFPGDRLLIWTSTPADRPGEHVGLYFGKSYSVRDDQRIGSTFEGSAGRTPFQGYALCTRTSN